MSLSTALKAERSRAVQLKQSLEASEKHRAVLEKQHAACQARIEEAEQCVGDLEAHVAELSSKSIVEDSRKLRVELDEHTSKHRKEIERLRNEVAALQSSAPAERSDDTQHAATQELSKARARISDLEKQLELDRAPVRDCGCRSAKNCSSSRGEQLPDLVQQLQQKTSAIEEMERQISALRLHNDETEKVKR